jgi:hypothetical protein
MSCADSPGKQRPDASKIIQRNTLKIKPPAGFSDTVTIDFSAAVFYSPDSLQLNKICSITDSAIFAANMHEYYNLMRNARLVISKNYPKLRVIEPKKVRFLLFVKADNSRECVDLNTKYDPYGIFAFNRRDPPRLLDMANIDTELGFYFTKQ